MPYNSRNNALPHPMYGINRPFSIADLSSSYNSGIGLFQNVSTDQGSPVFHLGANGFEINIHFSDGVTSCDIRVFNTDDDIIKEFTGVNRFNSGGLFVGYADDGILLGGIPLYMQVFNFQGGGSISYLKVRKTS